MSFQVTTTTPQAGNLKDKSAAEGDSTSVMDILDSTLWNRQLNVMSEEIVAALVCQIYEGDFKIHLLREVPNTDDSFGILLCLHTTGRQAS